jgi:hypothetical protein
VNPQNPPRSYDTSLGLLAPDRAAQEATAQQRADLLTGLGFAGLRQDPEFDVFAAHLSAAFAAELGHVAEGLYAMVNFISHQQEFVGLYNPPGKRPVSRSMRRDHGYCPEVADRALPLPLPDVLAAPQFASNPVVDAIGIRTYTGAPLIDPRSGQVFGTLCVVGTEQPMPKHTGDASLALIRERGERLAVLIEQRVSLLQPGPALPDPANEGRDGDERVGDERLRDEQTGAAPG